MRPNNQMMLDTEIELTAQELLAPLSANDIVDIEDIVAIESTYEESPAANTDEQQSAGALDETSEIELTAEQMDAMLEGRWP